MRLATLPALAAMLPAAAWAQDAAPGYRGYYDHPHMFGGYDGYGMIFGPVIWLIVLGLIVVGVVWAVRALGGGAGSAAPGGRREDPLELLRARYARGDIDTAEFEERKRALMG